MRLRAALAAVIVLGLGGTLAPSYARDAAAIPETATSIAETAAPIIDPSIASSGASTAVAIATDTPDADDGSDGWQAIGSGIASWYGARFAGHRTASGERFNPAEYTAAHRTLPFGTRVRVTNAAGDSVIVRINDRGPYAAGRLIDLSQAAARDLGLTRPGSGRVTLEVLDDDDGADGDQAANG